jgi:hypothetical protein
MKASEASAERAAASKHGPFCPGHGFTAGALGIEQDEAIEGVLFSAARALEERSAIARNSAARARGRDQKNVAATFEEKAKRAEQDAGSIHNLLLDKRKTASA